MSKQAQFGKWHRPDLEALVDSEKATIVFQVLPLENRATYSMGALHASGVLFTNVKP